MKTHLRTSQRVERFLPLFTCLQRQEKDENRLMLPIDVTQLVWPLLLPGRKLHQLRGRKERKVYLINQISDPNLGIHDVLRIKGLAEFTHVVVRQRIVPISEFFGTVNNPSMIQLGDVLENAFEQGKRIKYFVAQGNYDGRPGIHFCVPPYNDTVSCRALESLLDKELINTFKSLRSTTNDIQRCCLQLQEHLVSGGVDQAEQIFLSHFKKSLGI
jgi:hypothetical protein